MVWKVWSEQFSIQDRITAQNLLSKEISADFQLKFLKFVVK
jgi:hypothetical protein